MRLKKTQIPFDPSADGSPLGRALGIKVHYLKDHVRAFLAEVESLDDVKALDIRRGINLYDEVRSLEIELIRLALEQTSGNQRRAASLLDLRPTTLNAKIKLYGIHIAFHTCSVKEKRSE